MDCRCFETGKRRTDMSRTKFILGIIGISLVGSGSALVAAQQNAPPPMTFFVTSNGPGKGGNLGGLAGADAHCQMLAAAAGAGNRTWRAYLSTQGANAVNARDRIGKGPWHNADGVQVGKDVDQMHGITHAFSMDRILTEKGALIPNGNFSPNRHDILTGSTLDGKAYPAGQDMTCANWTSATTGKARVGHHDRAQWNSAHDSQGCTQENLRASGGDGLFYCFAAN
jgi:hypothetical protein